MRHQKTGDSIPDQAATSEWVPGEGRALTPSLAALPVLTDDVGLVFGHLAKPGFGAVGPSDFD